MPRGIPNKPASEPAPMIFVEPAGDGAIRLNAYGLDAGQTIDTLRRTLLHLVATESGVQVISIDVPAHAKIVPAHVAKTKLAAAKPSRNGTKPRPAPRYLAPAYAAGMDEDWETKDE